MNKFDKRMYTVKYVGIRTPNPLIAWRYYNMAIHALRRNREVDS